jgi:hypothetical protein
MLESRDEEGIPNTVDEGERFVRPSTSHRRRPRYSRSLTSLPAASLRLVIRNRVSAALSAIGLSASARKPYAS